MAAVRSSAEKETEAESAESYTQELSSSHTSSSTTSIHHNNNSSSSVGPQQCQSLDSHQSLLNGAQPNPFVCGGVLAAPCSDDSLPSGALVNGSASHCTSEEPHVPNKDASPLPRTDTNPEVLEPPCELQSNTWQKPEGHIIKAPSTRTLPVSDNSECETPSVEDNADNGAISLVWTNNSVKTGALWDVDFESESSESSSDNYDGLNRNLREKFMCLLLKGRILNEMAKGKIKVGGLQSTSSGRRNRKTCRVKKIPVEDVNTGFSCDSFISTGLEFDSSISKERSLENDSESWNAHTDSHLGNSQDRKNLISSNNVGGHNEAGTHVGGQPVSLKRQQETGLESKPSFFQCNVNFKEQRHLHRHMMYHLDWRNQVGRASIRPFICKECGRSFCERSSLQMHMLIHQVQREKLMEEIKDLNKPRGQGGEAQLQCRLCAFVASSPQTFLHHARTHEKDKQFYYSCEECNQIVSNRSDLEAHQQITHLNACHGRVRRPLDMLFCQICTFKTKYRDVLLKHLQLVHHQPIGDYEHQPYTMATDLTGSIPNQDRITDQTSLGERESKRGAGLPAWPDSLADLFIDRDTPNSCKSLSSSPIRLRFGSFANNLSQSSLQHDMPSKPSLPTERIHLTTGLSCLEEDSQECESAVSNQKVQFPSGFNMHLGTKSAFCSKAVHLDHDGDNTGTGSSSGGSLVVQKRKSPSKRKMSIPYHNTPKKIPMIVPKRVATPERIDIHATVLPHRQRTVFNPDNQTNGANCPSKSIAHFLDSSDSTDPFSRQGRLLKDYVHDSSEQSGLESNAEGEDEISTFIVKEEDMESSVSEDNPGCTDPNLSDSYSSYCVSPMMEPERKCCPYCPAVFESGVGLSNHIRGHLHRCGLSYEARHMLSPEQVASQDQQPRIRRRATAMNNRVVRTDNPECQPEHTCPLCLGWFDTKTGLSNHVRGHLKRIGKPISGVSKSPLCILTELLQDENEYENVLRALETKPRLSRPFLSRTFAGSEKQFFTPTGVQVKNKTSANRQVDRKAENVKRNKKEINKNNESTLSELLNKQKRDQKLAVTYHSEKARARFVISPSKKVSPEALPDSMFNQGRFEGNKKICIHCNATFHSGVSLSNHLRAHARRRKIAMLEETSYDCIQKLPHSRSGLKRKEFHTLQTTSEVTYTLTCRFCHLIFQGPQCVQEDWVKHLQRHLMHTAVSGTGAGMVEVPAVREEPYAPDCVTQGL